MQVVQELEEAFDLGLGEVQDVHVVEDEEQLLVILAEGLQHLHELELVSALDLGEEGVGETLLAE